MGTLESKLLLTLVGVLLLLSGGLWFNLFPVGGLTAALLGVATLVWAVNLFLSESGGRGRGQA